MTQNFVIFFTDDHARWATGCYGNSEIRSPTLDYLAETGVRMDSAFTPTPVCSPARASFFTGRIASQHGIHDYIDPLDPEADGRPWLEGQRTLPEILQDAGYTTGLSGKWHLGAATSCRPGFDYWYEQEQPGGTAAAHIDGPWPDRPASSNYDPHALIDRAVDFLRYRDHSKPFFLFVGLYATHSPWAGHAERVVSRYRSCTFADIPQDATYPFGRLSAESLIPSRSNPREAWAQYYAAVTEIDEQVGRLVDELETLGLRDETLLVYTSDHGLNLGHHGLWGKGNASKPYNMLEESIRVPLVLNQPGRVMSGLVRAEMVTHCDLFSTIMDYAGLDASISGATTPNPGRSYRALLEGGTARSWPDRIFGEYGNLRMVRTRRHKLVVRAPDGPHELFDLQADPRETANLYADTEAAAVVQELRSQLDTYFAQYQDAERNGLRVHELPQHNAEEMWRNPGADNKWWEHMHGQL